MRYLNVLLVAVVLFACLAVTAPAEAHGPRGNFNGNFRGNGGFRSGGSGFFFQQTNRGPFGRIRSQTTISR